jgi:antitoxin VapB
MDTAKVFMTGRSQAVRLPKAYRFETSEVTIEKRPDGAVVLRPKAAQGLGDRVWAVLEGAPEDPTFARPAQPALERDAAWWDAQWKDEPRKPAAKRAATAAKRKPRPAR